MPIFSAAMRHRTFGLLLLLATTLLVLTKSTNAATVWGTNSVGSGTSRMDILLVMDDASQKVYMQFAGPANRWFGWGYGANAMLGTYATVIEVGPRIHKRVLGNHAPGTMLANQLTVLSSCTNSGRAYVACERRLSIAGRYSFNASQTSLPLIWALSSTPTLQEHGSEGTRSMSRAGAPRPRLAALPNADGTVSVAITNLLIGFTNTLEVSQTMNSANWVSLAPLWRSPGCGPPLLSFMTNIVVPTTNSGQGFFRIKR